MITDEQIEKLLPGDIIHHRSAQSSRCILWKVVRRKARSSEKAPIALCIRHGSDKATLNQSNQADFHIVHDCMGRCSRQEPIAKSFQDMMDGLVKGDA